MLTNKYVFDSSKKYEFRCIQLTLVGGVNTGGQNVLVLVPVTVVTGLSVCYECKSSESQGLA